MLLQVLLIVFVALLVFRGGTLVTRMISSAKDAKKEFDRATDPVGAATPIAGQAKTVATSSVATPGNPPPVATATGAIEPDSID